MPKATYMYWQKQFDRENPNQQLEDEIKRIRVKHPIQVCSFTRKSRKFSTYKGKVGEVAHNRIKRRFRSSVVHQKITTDTTKFKYYQIDAKGQMKIKKLYLDPFMDMYNSEIVTY